MNYTKVSGLKLSKKYNELSGNFKSWFKTSELYAQYEELKDLEFNIEALAIEEKESIVKQLIDLQEPFKIQIEDAYNFKTWIELSACEVDDIVLEHDESDEITFLELTPNHFEVFLTSFSPLINLRALTLTLSKYWEDSVVSEYSQIKKPLKELVLDNFNTLKDASIPATYEVISSYTKDFLPEIGDNKLFFLNRNGESYIALEITAQGFVLISTMLLALTGFEGEKKELYISILKELDNPDKAYAEFLAFLKDEDTNPGQNKCNFS